jgi:hypothetical protein
MSDRYYHDYDEDTKLWCVFDSFQEPHKAVATFMSKEDASFHSHIMNYQGGLV